LRIAVKSAFLGRFLGQVRAIVLVVAGMSDMPGLRVTVVNVLSAVAGPYESAQTPRSQTRRLKSHTLGRS